MKAAVFCFNPLTEHTSTINPLLARYISDTLKIPAFDDSTIEDYAPDVLLIVNGIAHFNKHREALARAIAKCQTMVWVQNDCLLEKPPKGESVAESPLHNSFRQLRGKGGEIHFWSTVTRFGQRTKHSHYLNLNQLAFRPLPEIVLTEKRGKVVPCVFYYGGWRPERTEVMDHYFNTDGLSKMPVVVSTNARFTDKWMSRWPDIRMVPAIDHTQLEATLATCGLGLVLESPIAKREFISPPTRFYEMLGAGLPMIFEPESVTMFREAGFDIRKYTCAGPHEYEAFYRKRETIRAEQHVLWGLRDYRAEVAIDLKRFYKSLIKEVR